MGHLFKIDLPTDTSISHTVHTLNDNIILSNPENGEHSEKLERDLNIEGVIKDGYSSPHNILKDSTSRKLLLFTSCIFITNVISAYYKEDYIYATAFLTLTITSVICHSTVNIYTNILDKISIIIIVLYGLYSINYKTVAGYNDNIVLFFIIATFFSTIYLYGYGYCIDDYCFHPKYGNYYHALMHIIGSIGHHAIIFM